MLMIIVLLLIVGLCLGSFVNALVWRINQQSQVGTSKSQRKKKTEIKAERLSIVQGRSMCPHCYHQLANRDLIPVLSWLSLQGKCRYCNKPISKQYPLVEITTAALFVASYIWWPVALSGAQVAIFVLWLIILVGLVSLVVYDLRWLLLPNRITYPLAFVALVLAIISVAAAQSPFTALLDEILAVAVGGGIFYLLFHISAGKWIGGGDVKLGFLLGLLAATPARSVLFIFIAAISGSIVSLVLLYKGNLKRNSIIPFGPFLIIGIIVVQLFGASILHWYTYTLALQLT
jgi:leader peptidase (prepilin peptidase)/N-methyltransferase